MSQVSQTENPVAPVAAAPAKPPLPRGLVLAALAVLILFIGVKARALWGEWEILQGELSRTRASAIIGYPGITPRFSFANKPDDWYHHEGQVTLIWGGWKKGEGHQWF